MKWILYITLNAKVETIDQKSKSKSIHRRWREERNTNCTTTHPSNGNKWCVFLFIRSLSLHQNALHSYQAKQSIINICIEFWITLYTYTNRKVLTSASWIYKDICLLDAWFFIRLWNSSIFCQLIQSIMPYAPQNVISVLSWPRF